MTKNIRILLIEDDVQVQQFVSEALSEEGYSVTIQGDFSAQTQFELNTFDCLILDRCLPYGDTLSLIKSLAAQDLDHPPTLFLTALDTIEDKIAGLTLADDYLVKPFDVDELVARVKALLRRRVAHASMLEGSAITLHRLQRQVKRQGNEIDLNPMEFKLLEYLLLNKNQIVTRKMLLEHVWEYNFEPATSIVETYISRLRKKLEIDHLPPAIETIKGTGYTIADI